MGVNIRTIIGLIIISGVLYTSFNKANHFFGGTSSLKWCVTSRHRETIRPYHYEVDYGACIIKKYYNEKKRKEKKIKSLKRRGATFIISQSTQSVPSLTQ